MADATTVFVIDALALIHIARGDAYGDFLVNEYQLLERLETPMIAAVTVGDVLRIARRTVPVEAWEETTAKAVMQVVNQLAVVEISGAIERRYAEIMAMQDDNGALIRPEFGWVAATAAVTDSTVLTHNSDYKKLGRLAAYQVVDRNQFFS